MTSVDEQARTSDVALTRFDDVGEARRVLLGRRAIGDAPLPAAVSDKIRETFGEPLTPTQVVERIIADVRAEGDQAIRRYARLIDGREPDELLVSEDDIETATSTISAEVYFGLVRPLDRVGIYAPGGRAPYPSTALMAAIPARVAGVREIVMASPSGPDGEVAPVLLAAAKVAGVDAVYRMGGAQAIAALAYGTESVGRVDKILGPGNIFVALAKQQVYGAVGIDGLAGPTECLIVADETANPRFLAADLMAQAEHDPLAQPILFCTSRRVIDETIAEIQRRLNTAPRASIIQDSMEARGAAVLVPSVEEGIELSNEYAPEHLSLSVKDAWSKLGLIRNAGGVFVGEWSAEAIGDYTAGPSHIMPTGGTARFSSPLNLDDFLKITSIFSFGPGDLPRLGPPAIAIAHAEGLYAHAEAIEVRLRELDEHPA